MRSKSSPTKKNVVMEFRLHSIQEAAARVIAQDGLDGATLDAIAKEAGIAKGTIYLYFRNREELVEKTSEYVFDQLMKRLEPVFALEPSDIEVWLEALIRTLLDYFDDQRGFLRLYFEARFGAIDQVSARRSRRTSSHYEDYVSRLANQLERSIEAGVIRSQNASRLAVFLSEGLSAIVIQRLLDVEGPELDDDVELILGTMLRGIVAMEH